MKHLELKDVRFCFGMEKITGIIHAEQGVALFYAPDKGVISRYPGNLTQEDYDTEKTVWMYPATHKLKRRLQINDVPVDQMEDMDIDLYEDADVLDSMVEEERIRGIPRVMSSYASCFVSLVVGIASFLLVKHSQYFWITFGLALLVLLFSFLRARRYTQALGSPVVYDCEGNWVNTETGECSLNGGCIISHYSKEDSAL